ncbi:GNAT family N-acetyltransferase [Solitalea canadensis]|uniref:BioF2-like acetyltransferase domain-containing protein n=1 Tax=Solitalea canadensis (strain ATCC 29591 / DSM 3403 / JCM 21819 / LMG 8368 / NBRC 15130 / NCIMB 12057 / USAM 9D) TaxID=929556 RepID=H8KXA1_SOLCM|nr:GNAT family N-acetyltransferase [Solitalea canadensis]AFD08430.1 hypothetical protein Solca_3423 [Solitalea canadensis DSM 3403]
MDNLTKYKAFCDVEDTLPIYSTYWWLDAVCGTNNWNVLIIERDNKIIASWPIYIKKKLGFRMITSPLLTPILGIWLKDLPNISLTNKISHEIEICNELIDMLPKHDFFFQRFGYQFTNWLPFYWHHYKQQTHYSYVINNIKDYEHVLKGYPQEKRRKIRRAAELLSIKYDLSAHQFYEFHTKILQQIGKTISYPFAIFERLYNALYKHNAGRVIYAVDKDGNIHAALFIAWDKMSAYGILSAIDRNFGSVGGASLLAFEAIKMASSFVDTFDFEGSMIPKVEEVNRRSGGIQTPFFEISKTPSKILSLGLFLFKNLYLKRKGFFQ